MSAATISVAAATELNESSLSSSSSPSPVVIEQKQLHGEEVPNSATSDDTATATEVVAATTDGDGDAVVDHDLVRSSVGRSTVQGHYPCVYDRTNGTLFAGSGGVSFVGWVFFFEKRVDLDWKDVLQVVKTQHNDGTSSITFIMRTDDVEYEFTALQHIQRVWATLVTLHNDALLHDDNDDGNNDTNHHNNITTTPLRQSLRRMSTDPLYSSSSSGGGAGKRSSSRILLPLDVTEAAYMTAAAVASDMDIRASVSSRNLAASTLDMARRSTRTSSSRRVLPVQDVNKTVMVADGDIAKDLQQAWKELQAGGGVNKKSYATSAIQDNVLPCSSLDSFFETFVADDAPFPYKTYMEMKDSDVTVTPWKLLQQENDDSVYTRTIEYSHPVNAPLAPPMARARKEQRYRRYGNAGLSIETDTYVQDVPMADCFYVTDRVSVEPNEHGAVVILAEFDIVFVKSTMFRSMIANTTRSEFLNWFQGLVAYWSKALVSSATEEEKTLEDKAAGKRESSLRRSSLFASATVETVLVNEPHPAVVPASRIDFLDGNRPMILLLIMVLTLQSWIMLEMKGMKRALSDLQDMQTKVVVQEAFPTFEEEKLV